MPDFIKIEKPSEPESINGEIFNIFKYGKKNHFVAELWMGFLGVTDLENKVCSDDSTIDNNLIALVKTEFGHLYGIELIKKSDDVTTYQFVDGRSSMIGRKECNPWAAKTKLDNAQVMYNHFSKIVQSQVPKYTEIDKDFALYIKDDLIFSVAKHSEYQTKMTFEHKVQYTNKSGSKLPLE